jgi:hypothetical protein
MHTYPPDKARISSQPRMLPSLCIEAVLFTVRRESYSARWCVWMFVLPVLRSDRVVDVGDRGC